MVIALIIATLIVTAVMLESISVIFISALLLAIGNTLIALLSSSCNVKTYCKVYNTTFLVYTLYAMLCTIYMRANNFDYLFITDTITAYIPYTEEFIQLNSFGEMWDLIYNNTINKYKHVGVITIYFAYIGKLAAIFDNELYFNLQSSIIFLSSFISLFIYKLLKEQGIEAALKYAFIYSFLSIHFYYSALILRDIPISLFYVIAFCYIMKRIISLRTLITLGLCVLGAYLIRQQSALFLILFITVLFIKDKITIKTIFILGGLAIVASFIFIRLGALDILDSTLEHSNTLLQNKAADSTLNKFNILPPIVSHLVKVIYIQLSPIPSWPFVNILQEGSEESNIMSLPRVGCVLYNYVILGFILYGVYNYKKLKFDNKLLLAFLITLLYMSLQTYSTEQRRIMACYPILLLCACKVNDAIPMRKSKTIKNRMILLFIVMQIIGLTKYH